jgi:tRNA(Ile)-lysidine synthase
VTRPIDSAVFAVLMKDLGPFEPSPHIAVAVSGGSDSLALLLLLRGWLEPLQGRLTALTVDHGLRPEAAAECRQVGEIITRLNADHPRINHEFLVEHHILVWQGDKPRSGVMAAARDARYRLLIEWCRTHDVLHLALGHHADDQAETLMMRRSHGSGSLGLAGMAGRRMSGGVCLLRPLLACRKSSLVATARAAGLTWIEDPSNGADRFERVRWRQQLSGSTDLQPLLSDGRRAGGQRDQIERRIAAWFAEQARIDPAGHMVLALTPLMSLETEMALQALGQAILTVGGADFAPAPAALERLRDRLRDDGDFTTTLGGCLLSRRGETLSLFREAAACAPAVELTPEQPIMWDKRFVVSLMLRKRPGSGAPPEPRAVEVDPSMPLYVAAVSEQGLANRPLAAQLAAIAPQARPALPGLWQNGKLLTVAVPLDAADPRDIEWLAIGGKFYKLDVSFQPRRPATSCGFTVVLSARHTM